MIGNVRMKTTFLTIGIAIISVTSVFATGFSERKLESAKKTAERTEKLIAFVFYQAYDENSTDRNHTANVDAANNGAKRAIPRADALEVEIFRGDKETDKIPACVSKTGKTPRVIITDAKCENVIATYEGVPNRETLKAVEEKVTAARNLVKAAAEEKK
jgi:hypothetical protein